jgi:hypothetical protein
MKHLSYDDGKVKAEVDIRPATTGDGIRRDRDMYGDMPKDPVLQRAQQLRATLTAAADIQLLTVGGADYKLTNESVLELPGALTTLWGAYVFEVNPHWQFGITAEQLEELQKKAPSPSHGSKTSIEPTPKARRKI